MKGYAIMDVEELDLSSEELSDYRRREAVRPKELVLAASSLKRLAIL